MLIVIRIVFHGKSIIAHCAKYVNFTKSYKKFFYYGKKKRGYLYGTIAEKGREHHKLAQEKEAVIRQTIRRARQITQFFVPIGPEKRFIHKNLPHGAEVKTDGQTHQTIRKMPLLRIVRGKKAYKTPYTYEKITVFLLNLFFPHFFSMHFFHIFFSKKIVIFRAA